MDGHIGLLNWSEHSRPHKLIQHDAKNVLMTQIAFQLLQIRLYHCSVRTLLKQMHLLIRHKYCKVSGA